MLREPGKVRAGAGVGVEWLRESQTESFRVTKTSRLCRLSNRYPRTSIGFLFFINGPYLNEDLPMPAFAGCGVKPKKGGTTWTYFVSSRPFPDIGDVGFFVL